jgi:hypothetical protein
MKYSYYLICHKIKQTTYNSLIYRKLINQFKKNNSWDFLDNIYTDELNAAKLKIKNIKKTLECDTNIQEDLNDIILKLSPILEKSDIKTNSSLDDAHPLI